MHNIHRLHTYRRYAHEQVDDFFLVIGKAVGIELLADGGVFGFLFLALQEIEWVILG